MINNDIGGAITDTLQVSHRRHTAYHPQCNGLTGGIHMMAN